jgi:hypothetical protein
MDVAVHRGEGSTKMDKNKTQVKRKPYEKPKVSSSEAFYVSAAVCTLFAPCSTAVG